METKQLIKILANKLKWPIRLNSFDEIYDYVVETSNEIPDEEELENVLNYWHSGSIHADLREVPINSLKLNKPLRSTQKEKQYLKKDLETMPPILVMDNCIIDGHHRIRVAKQKGATTIKIYDIKVED